MKVVNLAAVVMASVAALGCKRSPPRLAVTADARADAPTPPPADVPGPIDAAVAAVPAVDTTTGASPAWQAGPPVVVGDTVDGAALRAANRARLAADRAPVTVLQGGTPRALGQRLCEAVVPRRPPATPVLLKPNIGGFDWFKNPKTNGGDDGVAGRITDPQFVRGVIDCLRARGHTAITVADGFGAKPEDWDRLIKVSGYQAMCAEAGVPLVALDDDGRFDVEGTQPGKPLGLSGMAATHVPTLLVPKLVAEHLDHGLFLSLPKLKAHRFAVFSLGIKSLQGVAMYGDAAPAYRQKWRTHKEVGAAIALVKKGDARAREVYVDALEKFAERMVDVFEIEAPHAVLVEGAPAMSGDGFQVLFPAEVPVAIGGTNPILVDRVGAAFLGLWDHAGLAAELGGHRTSPLLEVAAARFGVDLREPKVVGDGAALVATRRPARFYAMGGFVVDDVAAAERRRVHAAHVADDAIPAMDGVVEAVWATAPAIEFATDWRGTVTPHRSTVRLLWSSRGLHVLWQLDGAGLHGDASRPTDQERVGLYQEDCVELFLALDRDVPRRYVEIEVGPFGHWFDLLIDRSGRPGVKKEDQGWSGRLSIGTARDAAAGTATIEFTVAAPEVVAALVAGAVLPIGLDRMEGQAPRQYLMAFPSRTAKPSFHAPSGFGELVLDR
ncbi:MAG: DUF362 domain-containing protein [Kofleriaceae bacterium]